MIPSTLIWMLEIYLQVTLKTSLQSKNKQQLKNHIFAFTYISRGICTESWEVGAEFINTNSFSCFHLVSQEPVHYDFVFLPSSRKNERNHSQLQLFGSNIDSDVSSNMAIIGKINIWNIGPAAGTVQRWHCVRASVHLQGRRPQRERRRFTVL